MGGCTASPWDCCHPHSIFTCRLALLLRARQSSPISCHNIPCLHPWCAHCTLLALPCLFWGINDLGPSSVMPISKCSQRPLWWTSASWTSRSQAWLVHSVSAYGICTSQGWGEEGERHSTGSPELSQPWRRVLCKAIWTVLAGGVWHLHPPARVLCWHNQTDTSISAVLCNTTACSGTRGSEFIQ